MKPLILSRRGSLSKPSSSSTYLLDDEFSSFNSDMWQKYWFWGTLADSYWHFPSGEAQAYRAANTFVDANGVLNFVAKRENVIDFQGRPREYTSGMIQSNGIDDWPNQIPVGFSFTYGLIEARIKVAHAGAGIWDGFWLCTAGHPSDCSSGEIDIFEVIGVEPNNLHMNYHRSVWSPSRIDVGSYWTSPTPLGDDYHVYAVDWRPTHIAWLCDGVEHFRYTGPGIPNDPHYILLTHVVAESGGWGGAPNAQTVFPNTMFVDWIRVTP